MRFWAPKNPEHVSHFIVNLQESNDDFEAQCLRLKTLCECHNLHGIDILKHDIEGAEYGVLEDIVGSGVLPKAVCVEFDEGYHPQDGSSLKECGEPLSR